MEGDRNQETLQSEDAKRKISSAVMAAFLEKPPTIAVIGLSGTGKSSTLNALFGQKLPVSHSTRGTLNFIKVTLHATPRDKHFEALPFVFMDAPGLGEDVARDPGYLSEYEKYLPESDVILWVLAARNRALAKDQEYFRQFANHAEKVVIGINQTDLVHPNNWGSKANLPSEAQALQIAEIIADRQKRLSSVVNRDLPVVAYSAECRWRLVELLRLIMAACTTQRRFMFDMLSHVKPDDFLPQGISQVDRARISAELERKNGTERAKKRKSTSLFNL